MMTPCKKSGFRIAPHPSSLHADALSFLWICDASNLICAVAILTFYRTVNDSRPETDYEF